MQLQVLSPCCVVKNIFACRNSQVQALAPQAGKGDCTRSWLNSSDSTDLQGPMIWLSTRSFFKLVSRPRAERMEAKCWACRRFRVFFCLGGKRDKGEANLLLCWLGEPSIKSHTEIVNSPIIYKHWQKVRFSRTPNSPKKRHVSLLDHIPFQKQCMTCTVTFIKFTRLVLCA